MLAGYAHGADARGDMTWDGGGGAGWSTCSSGGIGNRLRDENRPSDGWNRFTGWLKERVGRFADARAAAGRLLLRGPGVAAAAGSAD